MVTNGLLSAADDGMSSVLVLLDLSAAFDTINHSILLDRLRHWVGISGMALEWFSSYLSNRRLCVSVNNYVSTFSSVKYGVAQGGPCHWVPALGKTNAAICWFLSGAYQACRKESWRQVISKFTQHGLCCFYHIRSISKIRSMLTLKDRDNFALLHLITPGLLHQPLHLPEPN